MIVYMVEINSVKKIQDFQDKSLLIVDDDNPFRERLARAMDKKAEVLFERLLEYFEEIMSADLSLQIWFDSGVDLTPNGDTTLSPQGVPRVVTSRSLDLQYGGLRSFISTKKEVKIESLERAIDELKYESESSSDGDENKLRKFLDNMNDLE